MPRALPPHPDLEHLRKQAKRLVRDLRAGDETARARYAAALNHAPPVAPRLADAQLAIAREYGFASWARLKRHVETNPAEALFHAAEGNYDLLIVSLGLKDFDGLRLCSQLRSLERTRNVPILAVAEPDNNTRLVRGLEIGVNDYLLRPIDKNEMLARVRTQIKKKRYTERLRDNVQMSIEMAITDALTGLFNRRYMESHLGTLVEQAAARGKPIAVLIVDIDYFKAVNDTHGHDAGDDVLREFALRIRKSIRNIDLACRYGGEEFVIVMPETDMAVATMVAERLRRRIATEPFAIQQGARNLDMTISIGIAALAGATDNAAAILKRADTALYRAKRDGRNRLVPDAA